MTVITPGDGEPIAKAASGRRATRDVTDFELELLIEIAVQFQERFPAGLPHWDPPRTPAIIEKMVGSIPDAGVIDEAIGLAYTTTGLTRWLGISRAAVYRKVARGELFALKDASRGYRFPSLQFHRDGTVLAGLCEIIEALDGTFTDPWEMARWLATPPADASPIRRLQAGDGAGVLAWAKRLTAQPTSSSSSSEPTP